MAESQPSGNATHGQRPAPSGPRQHAGLLQRLADDFWNGAPVEELLRWRADGVDELILGAWDETCGRRPGAALIAIGGYGRRELHPYSDVDVLVLLPATAPEGTRGAVEQFVARCWDLGLALGHSTRTVEQCARAAGGDIILATALMESRRLAGPARLFEEMSAVAAPDRIWPAAAFFARKRAEQRQRHARYHGTAYNLEPNLKEGPGGLRDIQLVGWVAQRHSGAASLEALVPEGYLDSDELDELVEDRRRLWALRYALHLVAGRAEERLRFDYQRDLAERLGFQDAHERNLGVEQLMRRFFRTVKSVEVLGDMLLERFRERFLDAGEPLVAPLDARFAVRNRTLAARREDLFAREPAALLDLFRVLAQHPELHGVNAETVRLVRRHAYLARGLQGDAGARRAFLGLLRSTTGVARELQRMSRLGVLGQYLPAFEAITGHMQYDLFHVYTVDQHSLFVVRNLRRFGKAEYAPRFPLAASIFKRLDKPELLYLAGLFHDIAKGRGGAHSELGAREAESFCTAHGLSNADTHLVTWLVRCHLLMSATAQRRDIADPEVVNAFARQVGDRRHLDYLYLLTVADIAATDPGLWNSWKDRLLSELFVATRYALRRGLENPIDREEWIAQTRAQAQAVLDRQSLDARRVDAVWKQLPEDYFLRLNAEQIAWQTAAVIQLEAPGPFIGVRNAETLGATEVFIYAPDRNNLFAAIAACLDNLGLNVVEARIVTTADGFAWDSFLVLDRGGAPLPEVPGHADVRRRLHRELARAALQPRTVTRLRPRRMRHFQTPLEVAFAQSMHGGRTQLSIVTQDRPGLLARISRVFAQLDIRIHDARIATFGERAEDFFSISGAREEPLDDSKSQEDLRICLRNALTD